MPQSGSTLPCTILASGHTPKQRNSPFIVLSLPWYLQGMDQLYPGEIGKLVLSLYTGEGGLLIPSVGKCCDTLECLGRLQLASEAGLCSFPLLISSYLCYQLWENPYWCQEHPSPATLIIAKLNQWQSIKFCYFIFLKILFILFLDRGERREKERERNINVWLLLECHPTRDLACNPGMCSDWEVNWWPFGSQGSPQSIELHQPGPVILFVHPISTVHTSTQSIFFHVIHCIILFYVKDRKWRCDMIYNKKYIFGLCPCPWHRTPKTLRIS